MRARSSFGLCVVVGVSLVSSRVLARRAVVSEEAQRRALLAQLAAASAEASPDERTDADLMYEAMKKWRGEPHDGGAVDRTIAQSKEDKKMAAKIHGLFWKDPFSENPHLLIPVRKQDRDLIDRYQARHATALESGSGGGGEAARLRAELSEARADAASAHAENNRLRSELARADGGQSDVAAADPANACAPVVRQARRHESHARLAADRTEAWNTPTPSRGHRRHTDDAGAPAAPPAETTAAQPSQAPAGWQSSDPRGIIVVPLDAPVEIHADKSARAR